MTDPKTENDRFIVDRFEDDGWAVLEIGAGVTIDVPALWLPEDAKEGDVLRLQIRRGADTSEVTFVVDHGETGRRTERVRSKLDRLRGRSDG